MYTVQNTLQTTQTIHLKTYPVDVRVCYRRRICLCTRSCAYHMDGEWNQIILSFVSNFLAFTPTNQIVWDKNTKTTNRKIKILIKSDPTAFKQHTVQHSRHYTCTHTQSFIPYSKNIYSTHTQESIYQGRGFSFCCLLLLRWEWKYIIPHRCRICTSVDRGTLFVRLYRAFPWTEKIKYKNFI